MLFVLFLVIGLAVIGVLLKQIVARAHKLNERIDDYHKEGPPVDPYAELARLIAEDRMSRTHRRPASRTGGEE